jgi:hypothetical protein
MKSRTHRSKIHCKDRFSNQKIHNNKIDDCCERRIGNIVEWKNKKVVSSWSNIFSKLIKELKQREIVFILLFNKYNTSDFTHEDRMNISKSKNETKITETKQKEANFFEMSFLSVSSVYLLFD